MTIGAALTRDFAPFILRVTIVTKLQLCRIYKIMFHTLKKFVLVISCFGPFLNLFGTLHCRYLLKDTEILHQDSP